MTYDYAERMARHRQAITELATNLARELTRVDQGGAWTAQQRGEGGHDVWFDLLRADGLELGLTWYEHTPRPTVRPHVKQLPGRYHSERITIEASFDPKRPPEALAKDVLRRVVKPWEIELPKIQARQAATVEQWNGSERRAVGIAQALGAHLREDARVLLQDGNDVPFGIGDYACGIDVDVKVSNYRDRATFKVEIENDQEFAIELAKLLRQRFLDRLERNGQTLCPNCQTRAADSSGFCSGCYRVAYRTRLLAEAEA